MKKIVALTGAGVSADSGLSTFRDSDGLWDNYSVEEICTPAALMRDREKVLSFYDRLRKKVIEAKPNAGHLALAKLEEYYDVSIITQNIDNLHERAGSHNVTHLHGEITKLRSSNDELATVPLDGWKQPRDARHPDGSLLRPYVVFFGEGVPMFNDAIKIMQTAEIVIIVGTSMAVYPAASLVRYVMPNVHIYVVDPGKPDLSGLTNPYTVINKKGAEGLPELANSLIQKSLK